jgi:hypothetical protein
VNVLKSTKRTIGGTRSKEDAKRNSSKSVVVKLQVTETLGCPCLNGRIILKLVQGKGGVKV